MNVSPSKETILKKIRKALSQPVSQPFPQSEGSSSVYVPLEDENAVVFAEHFSKLQGRFVYCINKRVSTGQPYTEDGLETGLLPRR